MICVPAWLPQQPIVCSSAPFYNIEMPAIGTMENACNTTETKPEGNESCHQSEEIKKSETAKIDVQIKYDAKVVGSVCQVNDRNGIQSTYCNATQFKEEVYNKERKKV